MRITQIYLMTFFTIFFSSHSIAQDISEKIDWQTLKNLTQTLETDSFSVTPETSKLVLLDFWASWCGPCRQSFPWMNAMKKKYAHQGLYILAINLDAEQSDALNFLSDVKADIDIAFDPDGSSAELLGVEAMPMSYLLNSKGEVLHKIAGFNSQNKVIHEEHIKQILGNR